MRSFSIPVDVDPCGGEVAYAKEIPEAYFPQTPCEGTWLLYFKPSGPKVIRPDGVEMGLLVNCLWATDDGGLWITDEGEAWYCLK